MRLGGVLCSRAVTVCYGGVMCGRVLYCAVGRCTVS